MSKGRLEDHILQKVIFREFRARYPRLHGKNAVKGYHGFGGSVTIAQLITDQGASGWGALCSSLEEAKSAVKHIVGQPVCALLDPAHGMTNPVLRPFDIALHDLAGVILDMPVSKMINPGAVSSVRVYDGAIYMNDIIPEEHPFGVEAVLQDCRDDWKLGHRIFKIKIGRGFQWMSHDEGMKRDIEIVKGIHALFPSAPLMVDANNGYSLQDAIDFLNAIEGVPIYWFEEPFFENEEEDRALHAFLDRNRPGTLIADGEMKPDIPQLLDLAAKGVLDILQPDVCGYGFTPWRSLMQKMVEKGFLASPHAWGDVVKTHYCAHLAAAYPHHIPCVEAVLGDSEGIDASGYTLHESMLTVPDLPGFGMKLVWAPEV